MPKLFQKKSQDQRPIIQKKELNRKELLSTYKTFMATANQDTLLHEYFEKCLKKTENTNNYTFALDSFSHRIIPYIDSLNELKEVEILFQSDMMIFKGRIEKFNENEGLDIYELINEVSQEGNEFFNETNGQKLINLIYTLTTFGLIELRDFVEYKNKDEEGRDQHDKRDDKREKEITPFISWFKTTFISWLNTTNPNNIIRKLIIIENYENFLSVLKDLKRDIEVPETKGGKKHSKREVLGKTMVIHKIPGDRKEYVKHKGKLITVKDYRELMKAKKPTKSTKPSKKTKKK